MYFVVLLIACVCTFAAQNQYEAFDAEFVDSPTPTTSTINTLITCHAGPSAGVIVTGHYVVVTRTHTMPCTPSPTNAPDEGTDGYPCECHRIKKHHNCRCHKQLCDNDTVIGEEHV